MKNQPYIPPKAVDEGVERVCDVHNPGPLPLGKQGPVRVVLAPPPLESGTIARASRARQDGHLGQSLSHSAPRGPQNIYA
eukprot:2314978-Pyramimonas_sp.AAC.1